MKRLFSKVLNLLESIKPKCLPSQFRTKRIQSSKRGLRRKTFVLHFFLFVFACRTTSCWLFTRTLAKFLISLIQFSRKPTFLKNLSKKLRSLHFLLIFVSERQLRIKVQLQFNFVWNICSFERHCRERTIRYSANIIWELSASIFISPSRGKNSADPITTDFQRRVLSPGNLKNSNQASLSRFVRSYRHQARISSTNTDHTETRFVARGLHASRSRIFPRSIPFQPLKSHPLHDPGQRRYTYAFHNM